jgi:hypothetical protein
MSGDNTFAVIIQRIVIGTSQVSCIYREVYISLDEFTALRFTAAGVPPAVKCMRILPMNKPLTFGMK